MKEILTEAAAVGDATARAMAFLMEDRGDYYYANSNQIRSMIQTDQRFPSVSSQTKGLQVNADSSIDVYFGPKPPPGKQSNWVQTVPGRGWNVILRLYGPLEPWFNKTWRPSEIELVQ